MSTKTAVIVITVHHSNVYGTDDDIIPEVAAALCRSASLREMTNGDWPNAVDLAATWNANGDEMVFRSAVKGAEWVFDYLPSEAREHEGIGSEADG